MDVPSWRSWTTYSTWLGCRYSLLLPVVTRTPAEHRTREGSVRKDKRRATVYCHHMQNIPFLGVVFASPQHLIPVKQVKLLHITQIFITQVDIPEVQLTWCCTVTITHSLHWKLDEIRQQQQEAGTESFWVVCMTYQLKSDYQVKEIQESSSTVRASHIHRINTSHFLGVFVLPNTWTSFNLYEFSLSDY